MRELVNPKLDPKARLGIYLGHLPIHAGSVALVLNPRTLHISPQYHVIFDGDFNTVLYLSSNDIPSPWSRLCKDSRQMVTDAQFKLATRWAMNEPDGNQDADHPVKGGLLFLYNAGLCRI